MNPIKGNPRSKLEGRNTDYNMYSTILTDSPGSVLFSTSNLLKRKDLWFSCLRLGLLSHRRSLRSSHLFLKWLATIFVTFTRVLPLVPRCVLYGVVSFCVSISPFLKCPWSIIDLSFFRIFRIFILSYFSQCLGSRFSGSWLYWETRAKS